MFLDESPVTVDVFITTYGEDLDTHPAHRHRGGRDARQAHT